MPEELHKRGDFKLSRHTEEQHLQSAECWLKTQAVCKTFQPNVDTFNANVVISNEESHSWCELSLVAQDDETNPVIVSESETIQPIVNQNQLQENKYAPTSKSKISVLPQGVDMSANSLAPCGRADLRTDGEKRVRIASRLSTLLRSNMYETLRAWSKFKTWQGEGLKVAFTEPSEGMSGVKVEQTSAETLSFRCVCERCCLTRGDVHKTSRKVAFTLAEVLITLGIIGVVAALTLPSLISQYQDKVLANKTRKAYSAFQNGLMLASQANDAPGDFSSVFPRNTTTVTVTKNLSKYFNGAKVCTSPSQNGCQQFYYKVSYTNPRYQNNGEVIKSVDLWNEKIILADGVIFYILSNATGCDNVRYTGTYKNDAGEIIYNEDGTPKTYDYYSNVCANIKMDVNGVQGPNQYGRDLYHLWVYQNKVVPATSQKDLGGDSLNNILSGKDKLIYTKY